MFEAHQTPFLVPFDGSFRIESASTRPPEDAPGKKDAKKKLEKLVDRLDDLQRRLYARDRHALLLVFQAMDAAGKDGTIRAVMSGVNPAGCQVFSFKKPSREELDHDFLWRTSRRLPERGRIGIFNRSYYEEVLVVRVHPSFLGAQRLPRPVDLETIWDERFESIREHEAHLARNGTVILKFWLNVSRKEQRRRFLSRIEDPRKNWKFEPADVRERAEWDDYMAAYEEALASTSRSWAPWYAIPADDKPFMRMTVAETIVANLERLDLDYPAVSDEQRAEFDEMRRMLDD
ncbi:MAG: polyphosphate kinase 2 family protein [Acidobacteriota bacterium]|nr:polyphosphate kinase 2 family protein [Acidobacteriota bacterium]